MEKPERLQKILMEILQKELDSLNPELQTILIDDMISVFYNRLSILKKISKNSRP
jgi:hypothetical protein